MMRFWKYEGAGNDFVMVDGREGVELTGDDVRMLCDRHRGVGADGVIVLERAEGYDFAMRYYNADGGEVEMCGNGGRCIALLADHLGIGGDRKRFLGRDGAHEAVIVERDGERAAVALGMVDVERVGRDGAAFVLNTGVPHYVEFVDDVEAVDVCGRGREIRHHERFAPAGTNVNFAARCADGGLRVRTYERGVEGETLACGTGATAAAIAACAGCGGRHVAVRVDGGELRVSFRAEADGSFRDIVLTGPARRVFSGTLV
jgi:diaminopimelate epimerase